MAKVSPIQEAFNAGEISPSVYGRYSSDGYKQGLETCINAVTDSRGPVRRRTGSQLIYRIQNKTNAKVFDFHLNRDESYAIVLVETDGYIIGATDRELGPEQVANYNFHSDMIGWNPTLGDLTNASAAVIGNVCILASEGATAAYYAEIHAALTLNNDTASQTVEIDLNAGGTSSGTGCRIRLGTTIGGAEINETILYDNALYYEHTFTATQSPIYITIRQLATATNGKSYIKSISCREVVPGGAASVATFTHTYKDSDLEKIQAVMAPDGLNMYFCHNDYAPRKLNWADPTWTFSTVAFTATPAAWVANNYPGTMTFFQGRSWWANTPSSPETFWGSQSGTYENMTTGAGASDALEFSIAEAGLIVWIASSKNLLVGTELAEWIVTSEGGVIYGGDVDVEKQSGNGSKSILPEMLGNNVLYVSADGEKLRQMYYQWTESGFLSQDVTYANNHINNSKIRSVAYGRNPDQSIFMTQQTGAVVGCSYYRDGNKNPVYGWHRHRFGDAVVTDMVAMEFQGNTQFWMTCQRYVNGQYEIHVELYTEARSVVKYYMDSWMETRSETLISSVTGADHLEGKTVQVLVDGATHPDAIVSSGGVTLASGVTGYVIAIGVPYLTTIKTLPFAQSTKRGQTASFKKRYSKIFLQLLNSAMPKINGKRPPERSPSTLMNEAEGPTTGIVEVQNLGFDREASITITQELPLPLEISGVYGELGASQL